MALIKKKTLPTGVEYDYHKITSISLKEGEKTEVTLSSFLSTEKRQSGCAPIDSIVLFLDGVDKTNVFGSLYTAIKKSVKITRTITPERRVVFEDGSEEITPAVNEEVETNFFADAVDA